MIEIFLTWSRKIWIWTVQLLFNGDLIGSDRCWCFRRRCVELINMAWCNRFLLYGGNMRRVSAMLAHEIRSIVIYFFASSKFLSEQATTFYTHITELRLAFNCTNWSIDWQLVSWHVNTDRSICSNYGHRGNWLRWLMMANEIQCIIPYVKW